MFKEIDTYDYIAKVYCADVMSCFENDVFDFSSMIYEKTYIIDSIYDVSELCNYIFKNYEMIPVTVEIYANCKLYKCYRIEQIKNKLHFIETII